MDGSEEEFIISGFYEKIDEKSSVYPMLFSGNHSENGKQLKDVPYAVVCKIKNINPNNFFTNSLTRPKENVLVIIIVAIGILFVSILVVYSIFYISVLDNINRFGWLRTIGTSKKQIKAIVRREGAIMFALGTPVGLLISWITSY